MRKNIERTRSHIRGVDARRAACPQYMYLWAHPADFPHIPVDSCSHRFVWNIFAFPEILLTLKTQKMPNNTNTKCCQTAEKNLEKRNHKRDKPKRRWLKQITGFNILCGQQSKQRKTNLKGTCFFALMAFWALFAGTKEFFTFQCSFLEVLTCQRLWNTSVAKMTASTHQKVQWGTIWKTKGGDESALSYDKEVEGRSATSDAECFCANSLAPVHLQRKRKQLDFDTRMNY